MHACARCTGCPAGGGHPQVAALRAALVTPLARPVVSPAGCPGQPRSTLTLTWDVNKHARGCIEGVMLVRVAFEFLGPNRKSSRQNVQKPRQHRKVMHHHFCAHVCAWPDGQGQHWHQCRAWCILGDRCGCARTVVDQHCARGASILHPTRCA